MDVGISVCISWRLLPSLEKCLDQWRPSVESPRRCIFACRSVCCLMLLLCPRLGVRRSIRSEYCGIFPQTLDLSCEDHGIARLGSMLLDLPGPILDLSRQRVLGGQTNRKEECRLAWCSSLPRQFQRRNQVFVFRDCRLPVVPRARACTCVSDRVCHRSDQRGSHLRRVRGESRVPDSGAG
jgi:hypothetical protein